MGMKKRGKGKRIVLGGWEEREASTKIQKQQKKAESVETAATKCFPLFSTSCGYTALFNAAFFPGSNGRAWIKLMYGHVLAAYYLLQF